jgi:hypothetical protein
MDVPGNYIGNTAQQEMLGLWTAMAVFNCVLLHVHYAGEWKTEKLSRMLLPLNLLVMSLNAWGLWNTTSRGGILAFMVGFVVIIIACLSGKLWRAAVHILALFGVVLAFLGLVIAANSIGGASRAGMLAQKMLDMAVNPGTFGDRIAIWRVSGEVFLAHPVAGVGLGHYKWHFLDGQRLLYEKSPELLNDRTYKWQFTYWAHNEYLQWLCETGLIGSIPLLALGIWWLYLFLKAIVSRRRMTFEAMWGVGMVFLLFFDAMFSRPFHRIENAVWMSLAFAQINGFLLPRTPEWAALATGSKAKNETEIEAEDEDEAKREPLSMWEALWVKLETDTENKSETKGATVSEAVYKAFGVFIAAAAMCGLIFLGGGMIGDKLMLRATLPGSNEAKRGYLEQAGRFLMARDDALEQTANLDISIGDWDDEAYVRGVRELYAAFKTRPNSERLFKLFECARELNNAELLRELIPYLPPGSVSLR